MNEVILSIYAESNAPRCFFARRKIHGKRKIDKYRRWESMTLALAARLPWTGAISQTLHRATVSRRNKYWLTDFFSSCDSLGIFLLTFSTPQLRWLALPPDFPVEQMKRWIYQRVEILVCFRICVNQNTPLPIATIRVREGGVGAGDYQLV